MPPRLRSFVLAGLLTLALPQASSATLEEDLAGLSDAQIEYTVEFAMGNALFFLFHEAGHLLVSEFDLPVLGREEDAVDTLSALLMLEAEDAFFDTALISSVDGWTFSAEERNAAGEALDFSGAHALDEQRAFNMVCLMIGKDAEKFAQSADELGMPEDRREDCGDEYQKARNSWYRVIEPHIRIDDGTTDFVIRYETPKHKGLRDYAALTKETEILESLREVLSGLYTLDDGIKLTAAQCDEPNAYWSAQDREITYCYELMQWHVQAIAQSLRDGDDSLAVSASRAPTH